VRRRIAAALIAIAACASADAAPERTASEGNKPDIEIGGVATTLGAGRSVVFETLGAKYRIKRGQSAEWVVWDPSPEPIGTVIGRLEFTGDRLSYAQSTRAFADDAKPADVLRALFSILDKSVKGREVVTLRLAPFLDENLVSRTIVLALPNRTLSLAVDDFTTGSRRFTLVRVDESIGELKR
jgi:hypothetical protein